MLSNVEVGDNNHIDQSAGEDVSFRIDIGPVGTDNNEDGGPLRENVSEIFLNFSNNRGDPQNRVVDVVIAADDEVYIANEENERNLLPHVHPILRNLLHRGDERFGGTEHFLREVSSLSDNYDEWVAWSQTRDQIFYFTWRVQHEGLENEIANLTQEDLVFLVNPQNFQVWLNRIKNPMMHPGDIGNFFANQSRIEERPLVNSDFTDPSLAEVFTNNDLFNNRLTVNMHYQDRILREAVSTMVDFVEQYAKRFESEKERNLEQLKEVLEVANENLEEVLNIVDTANNTTIWLWVAGGLGVLLVGTALWFKIRTLRAEISNEMEALKSNIGDLKKDISQGFSNPNTPELPQTNDSIRSGLLVSIGVLLERLRRELGILKKLTSLFKWRR